MKIRSFMLITQPSVYVVPYMVHTCTQHAHATQDMQTHMRTHLHAHTDAEMHTHGTCMHTYRLALRDMQTHIHVHPGTQILPCSGVASPPPGPAPQGRPAPAGGVLPTQRHLQSALFPLLREEGPGRCFTFAYNSY